MRAATPRGSIAHSANAAHTDGGRASRACPRSRKAARRDGRHWQECSLACGRRRRGQPCALARYPLFCPHARGPVRPPIRRHGPRYSPRPRGRKYGVHPGSQQRSGSAVRCNEPPPPQSRGRPSRPPARVQRRCEHGHGRIPRGRMLALQVRHVRRERTVRGRECRHGRLAGPCRRPFAHAWWPNQSRP